MNAREQAVAALETRIGHVFPVAIDISVVCAASDEEAYYIVNVQALP